MKNFASLLFGFLLLTNLGFKMALESGSFHPVETIEAKGTAVTDSFGFSVSRAGDIDGDDYDDIIIGANGKSASKGAAYVIYGGKLSSLRGLDLDFLTETLDPLTTGFMITGSADNDFLGQSVSTAGDIDNDGYDDIIIGAYGKNSYIGAAYVIYGGPRSSMSNWDFSTGATLTPSTTGFMITGAAASDMLGYSVSSAGDINKDGYDDILIGSPFKNSYRGIAYVIYGGPKSAMSNIVPSSTTLIPSSTGFTIIGNAAQDWFGSSVSTAGDINDDGYADIIIGAYSKNTRQGAAYVIYGGEKSSMSNWDFSTGATLTPSTTGFMMTGDATEDRFGCSVSSAGDINNDGFDDLIIGSSYKNSFQGAAYVIYGGEKATRSNIALSSTTLNPTTTGFMITGNAANDYFGSSVSKAGDVNQDGYDDMIIGAHRKDASQGAAYVIYGGEKATRSNIALSSTTLNPTKTGFMITGNAAQNYFGNSVSGAGDVNKDGYDDIIIGAHKESTGRTYLILNQCSEGCETCDSYSKCKTCSQRYALVGSKCDQCSENCESCSSASTCIACASPYFLYKGECYSDCPLATFASSMNTCQDCSDGCSVCSSPQICGECLDGYTPTPELLCQKDVVVGETTKTEKEKIEEKGDEKAAAGVFEGTSLVGASLSSGSSLPLNFGLVAKIIRNFKYMALPVSRELQGTFVSWKVASGFMSAPDSWSERYSSKIIPAVFSRYGLQSAFLINFWKPFSMALIGMAIFAIFKTIEISMGKSSEKKSTIGTISRQVNVAASNFALTQIYSNLDDVLFYFILEMRSTKFETGFRVCSSLLAVFFLVVGGLIIWAHWKLIAKYQNLKGKENSKQLKIFQTKCENINLIFKDFKDTNTLAQSFLMINVMRSVISSLIFATLFEYPMIQISFLFVLNILMLVYLLNKKSFKELANTGGQIFCEFILFIANICVFLLALFDHADSYPTNAIENLGKCIIVLNYILLFGCAILLLVNMGKMLYQSYLERKNGVKVSQAPMENRIFAPEKLKSTESAVAQSDHSISTNSGFINESHNNLNHLDSLTNYSPIRTLAFENHMSPNRHSNMREIPFSISVQNRTRNQNLEMSNLSSHNVNPQSSQIAGDFEEEINHTVLPRSRLLRNREITKARIAQFSSSPENKIEDRKMRK